MCRKLLAGLLTFVGAWLLASCSEQETPTAPMVAEPRFNAAGSDFECVNTTATGPHDNIVVPPGAACAVVLAMVRGNIKALQGASLFVSLSQVGGSVYALQGAQLIVSNSHVGGSIYGDKPSAVQVGGGTIVNGNIDIVEAGPSVLHEAGICGVTLPTGNIKITKTKGSVVVGGTACAAGVVNNLLKGNLQVEETVSTLASDVLQVQSLVAQNLQVYKNTGPASKTVMGNTVGESIQCFENDLPFVGGPNTAPKKEGQCF
jgi:hypothetical protein